MGWSSPTVSLERGEVRADRRQRRAHEGGREDPDGEEKK